MSLNGESPHSGSSGESSFNEADHDEASPPASPYKPTEMEIRERDETMIRHSRAQLDVGDVLVVIEAPLDLKASAAKGSYLTYRAHSHKLARVSPVFARMLSSEAQARIRRRPRFSNFLQNPANRYIIDLSPADTDEESIALVQALSCPGGILNWYKTESTLRVSRDLVSGTDELAIIEPTFSFADGLDGTSGPYDGEETVEVQQGIQESLASEDAAFQRAIEMSTSGDVPYHLQRNTHNFFRLMEPTHTRKKQDMLDYTTIRHIIGLETLLQIIEDKVYKIDSAPKLYTLAKLAREFECQSTMVSEIYKWVYTFPNCLITEILPEAMFEVGLSVNHAQLAQNAFAVLVSEQAFVIAGGNATKRAKFTCFGRAKDITRLDEDLTGIIEAAAYGFESRIRGQWEELLSADMHWLSKLKEYKKLEEFLDGYRGTSRLGIVCELQRDLKDFVRGHILAVLFRPMSTEASNRVNFHCSRYNCLSHGAPKQFADDQKAVYEKMALNEKIMTRSFWSLFRDNSYFSTQMPSNLLDVQPHDGNLTARRDLAMQYGFLGATEYQVHDKCVLTNRSIKSAIENNLYNPTQPSQEDSQPRGTKSSPGETADLTLPTQQLTIEDIPDDWEDQNERNVIERIEKDNVGVNWVPISAAHIKKLNKDENVKGAISPTKIVFSAESDDEASTRGILDFQLDYTSPIDKGKGKEVEITPQHSHPSDADASQYQFSFSDFLYQVSAELREIACGMLTHGSFGTGFELITETLLCLTDAEFKFLPLAVGGTNDDTGGVFQENLPQATLGASGPGPSYTTGQTIATGSDSGTEMDWTARSSVGTSVAVENGHASHLDRREVVSESEFGGTATVSSDTESFQLVDFEDNTGQGIGFAGASGAASTSAAVVASASGSGFGRSSADPSIMRLRAENERREAQRAQAQINPTSSSTPIFSTEPTETMIATFIEGPEEYNTLVEGDSDVDSSAFGGSDDDDMGEDEDATVTL